MLDLVKNKAVSMITDSNIAVLILTGRGPNYSHFQILTTESSNK